MIGEILAVSGISNGGISKSGENRMPVCRSATDRAVSIPRKRFTAAALPGRMCYKGLTAGSSPRFSDLSLLLVSPLAPDCDGPTPRAIAGP